MALYTASGRRDPTSEQGSWDFLSSRPDELSSSSSDFNGVGIAFGDLDSHPSDISVVLSAFSDDVNRAFDERDDTITTKLANFDAQADYMSDSANFPNLSSEELMSQREAREQARADLVRLKEENLLNRIRYDELRDEIINSIDANLTPTQVLSKMEELGRVEEDLLESNVALRRMTETEGGSSSGDGDDEASSGNGSDEDPPNSPVDDSSEFESRFAPRSDSNSAADGGNNDASTTNQVVASDDQDVPVNDQNETLWVESDNEIYKIDVKSVFDPDCTADTRRVLLYKIPLGTTLTQVANAVCGVGGLLRISIMNNIGNSGRAFKMACVEFRDSAAAKKYVANVKDNGLELINENGRFFDIEVKLINSNSSYNSYHGHPINYGVGRHSEHSGRCITMDNFPASAIWHLFRRFGTKYIIRAVFRPNNNQMNGKLCVELDSVFEAGRLCYMILNQVFLPYHGPASQMGFGSTPSDRDVEELTSSVSNTIAYVSPKHLSDAWNVQPFNLFTPSANFAYGAPIPRRAVTSRNSSMNMDVRSRTSSMNVEAASPAPSMNSFVDVEVPQTPIADLEASRTQSMNAEVLHPPEYWRGKHGVVPHVLVRDDKTSTMLRDVQLTNVTFNFVDDNTKYIIVEGQVYSREINGDIYTKLDDMDLTNLKQDNLLKPNWAPFWKHFCEANELPYLPKYAEYGRIANIRRNINKKFGFPSSWNPERLTSLPSQIKAYLNPKSRKVVSTAEAEQK
ncbi:hypothetical protein F52700_9291 [Fusarium sp. NRRL 52700]|nr:hypothetical protein F52700_9291 [Fusarium sp. NRRL 52700]